MQDEDKSAFVKAIKNNFSHVTPGDAPAVWQLAKGFPFSIVKEAIEQHRVDLKLMAFRPDPAAVAVLCARIQDREYRRFDAVRYNGETAAEAEARRDEAARNKATLERIERVVSKIPADKLPKLKEKALGQISDDVREFCRKRDPLRCPILRAAIAEIVEPSQRATADELAMIG